MQVSLLWRLTRTTLLTASLLTIGLAQEANAQTPSPCFVGEEGCIPPPSAESCPLIDVEAETVSPRACRASAETMCLQGNRFRVTMDWRGFNSSGQPEESTEPAYVASAGTADSGLFYFYGPDNWEVLVKVLDACGTNGNGHFWVFAAAATTLEFILRVEDSQTGQVRTYFNPIGQEAPSIADTTAFATCDEPPGPPEPPTRCTNNRNINDCSALSTGDCADWLETSSAGQFWCKNADDGSNQCVRGDPCLAE